MDLKEIDKLCLDCYLNPKLKERFVEDPHSVLAERGIELTEGLSAISPVTGQMLIVVLMLARDEAFMQPDALNERLQRMKLD
tara:strand:+ start:463 stop:708 length:246 start_codon:yes stop_codon:yes gene_type:complete